MPKSNYDGSLSYSSPSSTFPRAIRLSMDPELSAGFIIWALETGLLLKMSSAEFKSSSLAISANEIGPGGAREFWRIVEKKFD